MSQSKTRETSDGLQKYGWYKTWASPAFNLTQKEKKINSLSIKFKEQIGIAFSVICLILILIFNELESFRGKSG